jgi:2,3-bisphosphoglycerate-dependent phosphoglycerate mutase
MNNRRYLLLFVACLICFFAQQSAAQSSNKTIVLVRHAEKNPPVDGDKGDPDLSAEGRERAVRLMRAVKKYKPHEIFATEYKRTKQTAEPIAQYRKKQIQTYDASKQAELVSEIMASKTDHYLIVGHSNTIPGLANLLAKKEIFRNLVDAEHGVIWVIRLKKGVLQKVEIFTY